MTVPPPDGRRWLRYEPSDAAVALIVLPHAGGGAASFNRWIGLFAPDIATVRVQLPGREDRAAETPLRRVDDAVDALTVHITGLIDRPVALYGHSMGALIVFELARALAAAGQAPIHLFVSGRRAPQRPARHQRIHHLPDDAFVAALEAMGGTAGMTTGQNAAFRRYAAPLIKADLQLSEDYTYRHRPALACPITAFAGTEDPMVDAGDITAWRVHTDWEFRLRRFPGDHFFHQRHREPIAATIVEALGSGVSASHGQGRDTCAVDTIVS